MPKILERISGQVKAPESNNETAWISRFLGALWVDNSEVERTKLLHADLSGSLYDCEVGLLCMKPPMKEIRLSGYRPRFPVGGRYALQVVRIS